MHPLLGRTKLKHENPKVPRAKKKKPVWSVYLVRTRDGTLYTGIATDVDRRITEHSDASGKGSKFLRGRGPLRLAYRKAIGAKSVALRVESRIKKLSKARKELLIRHEDDIQSIIDECGVSRS